jgi:hypothetical protein
VTSGRTTVKLKEPIRFGEQVVDELALRKPKAKDFRSFPENPTMGDVLDLVGRLSGQPKQVIDELGVEDLAEVSKLVEGFIPGGRATGTEPSP